MIEKKRLEELIEQGATIYWLVDNQIREVPCKDIPSYWLIKDNYNAFDRPLFETKEEAEWHKEFGCIERTERLELPTWEEFKNDGEFSFLDKQGFEWDLYSPDDETRISLVSGYDHYEFDYTKENYTLACRKAKELFLGEKK